MLSCQKKTTGGICKIRSVIRCVSGNDGNAIRLVAGNMEGSNVRSTVHEFSLDGRTSKIRTVHASFAGNMYWSNTECIVENKIECFNKNITGSVGQGVVENTKESFGGKSRELKTHPGSGPMAGNMVAAIKRDTVQNAMESMGGSTGHFIAGSKGQNMAQGRMQFSTASKTGCLSRSTARSTVVLNSAKVYGGKTEEFTNRNMAGDMMKHRAGNISGLFESRGHNAVNPVQKAARKTKKTSEPVTEHIQRITTHVPAEFFTGNMTESKSGHKRYWDQNILV